MKKGHVQARRVVRAGESGYGWLPGKAWWDYSAPSFPSGPDKDGWGGFLTARIYEIPLSLEQPLAPKRYLAISEGCHWVGTERRWSPRYTVFAEVPNVDALGAAMDWCEAEMVKTGVLLGVLE